MNDRPPVIDIPEQRIIFDRIVSDGENDIGLMKQTIARLITEKADAAAKARGQILRNSARG
jgi:hypothetical protein